MSNISSTIFQVGYKYSADRFLWRNSKLCKCLPQELKVEVRKLFDNYVIKWCSLDIFSEEFLKNELVALKELQRKLSILQKIYNYWCRCAGCYKKRLEINDYNIDNHVGEDESCVDDDDDDDEDV
jgi:hypothetical protein